MRLSSGDASHLDPVDAIGIQPTHFYESRPRKDHRGVDLISDALPFGRLWYAGPHAVANAIGYRYTATAHMTL